MKIADGSDQPINEQEPQFPPGVPACPKWLDRYARMEWRRIVTMLPPQMLRQVQQMPLACYCQAVSDMRKAVRTLRKEGLTSLNDKGALHAHPLIAARNKAMELIKSFAVEFGFTPSSSTRVRVPNQAGPVDEEKEMFGT